MSSSSVEMCKNNSTFLPFVPEEINTKVYFFFPCCVYPLAKNCVVEHLYEIGYFPNFIYFSILVFFNCVDEHLGRNTGRETIPGEIFFNMKCSVAGFSRPRTVTVSLTSCNYLYLCFCSRGSGEGERKTHQS